MNPNSQMVLNKHVGKPVRMCALAPSNKLIWYCSIQYSVSIGATLHQYIQPIDLHVGMCDNLAAIYLVPTHIRLMAVLSSTLLVLPYPIRGWRKGTRGRAISTSLPIDCHVGMLTTCYPLWTQLITVGVDKPHVISANHQQ